MSLMQCPNCERFYTLSDEHYKHISAICDVAGFAYAVGKCSCGAKYGEGGELDVNPMTDETGIMLFGFDYIESEHSHHPVFDSIMLVETTDENTNWSTYHNGKTIHLKPE